MAFPAYGWHQCPTHRFGVDLDAASLRRRISTLEARLARVLYFGQCPEVHARRTLDGPFEAKRGRTWSRKRTGGR